MNKIAIINTCDWGSTGKIAKGLQAYLKRNGMGALFCYGRGTKRDDKDCFRFCSVLEVFLHYAHTYLTGRLNGCSNAATKRLIAKLQEEQVKEVYLINLHGYILNEHLFLDYLANDDIHVVYIMADESAYLGNCTYRLGCEEYKNGCSECRNLHGLSKMIFPDTSQKAFSVKKAAYERIKHVTFVGPEFVIIGARTSPLMENKNLEIVDEAIDVEVNSPLDTTQLREKLGIKLNQIVIVCVAPFSYPRKGVRYLVEAARKMEDNENYIFVHVGYDIKDRKRLPKNYIPIGYVNGQQELAHYYSLADLFVFPSIQDTMPNACLEALACGSPLLCFNISGMPYIADKSVMTLVEARNVIQMVEVIMGIQKKDETIIKTCRNYALKRFDNRKYFEKLTCIMESMK